MVSLSNQDNRQGLVTLSLSKQGVSLRQAQADRTDVTLSLPELGVMVSLSNHDKRIRVHQEKPNPMSQQQKPFCVIPARRKDAGMPTNRPKSFSQWH